jgi:WD40 repeat protein
LPAGVPAFAPDGRLLAVAAKDKVQLYAVDTGSKMREWDFPGVVHAIAFAADGRHLATANANGTVYILRLASAVQ